MTIGRGSILASAIAGAVAFSKTLADIQRDCPVFDAVPRV
jgi:hypothetical protein